MSDAVFIVQAPNVSFVPYLVSCCLGLARPCFQFSVHGGCFQFKDQSFLIQESHVFNLEVLVQGLGPAVQVQCRPFIDQGLAVHLVTIFCLWFKIRRKPKITGLSSSIKKYYFDFFILSYNCQNIFQRSQTYVYEIYSTLPYAKYVFNWIKFTRIRVCIVDFMSCVMHDLHGILLVNSCIVTVNYQIRIICLCFKPRYHM
ncbi:Hypothetical_protein [Hexamita inflata]|uniref:Hypothetical_protein n=1 Tax=Hexamita inflata TaxID=28002 RepID=A0AA86PRD8_9EUKA|nr:Hypothetical protein HINF_LOCUS32404 [Hexamita inflata]